MSQDKFYDELVSLINSHSKENESDTPDFILAEYLLDCLSTFNRNIRRREEWYGRGRKPEPPLKFTEPIQNQNDKRGNLPPTYGRAN